MNIYLYCKKMRFMKTKKLSFPFIILMLSFAIFSCEKEFVVDNYDPTTGGGGIIDTTGGGGGGGIDTTRDCRACAYIPTCNGTVYTYRDSSDVVSTVTQTFQIIKDTLIGGKTYQKSLSEGVTQYLNCTNGETTSIEYMVTNPVTNTLDEVKVILLKANSPVNSTWNATINGQNIDYVFKIISKGPRTVNGVNYPDVIHVNVKNSFAFPGLIQEEDIFYARGVGAIEYIIYDMETGAVDFHRTLQSYIIP